MCAWAVADVGRKFPLFRAVQLNGVAVRALFGRPHSLALAFYVRDTHCRARCHGFAFPCN